MPFKPHFRVSALGRLSSSGERFSYGLSMAPNNGAGDITGPEGTITLNDDAWADVAEDVRSFHGHPDALISTRAVLETVKIARIGQDGKYLSDPRIFDVADTPGGSVQSGLQHLILPQAALAVSLTTGRRGPSGKGRFYLPMPVAGLDAASFALDPNAVTACAALCQTFINDLNNAPGFDVTEIKVCVASTKGFNTGVTGVRLGRIVDVVRSRRSSLQEAHTAPLPIA